MKIKCFFLLCFENCILTWDKLVRRRWAGPNLYVLCEIEGEFVLHLMVHYDYCTKIWNMILEELQITQKWGSSPIEGFWGIG